MDLGIGPSIAFWIMAIAAVMSAIGVVLLQDLFRAALFLVLMFLLMSGLFVTLNADFVAVVQILIYAGAISILLIFAILLTGQVQRGNPSNQLRIPAAVLGCLLAIALTVSFLNSDFGLPSEKGAEGTTSAIADSLFNSFLLPFEIASLVLLAAVIGSIVLAQGSDE